MTTDPSLMSATELLRLYRAKKLSPVEATRAALARIAQSDHALNSYTLVTEEDALRAARESEARWAKGAPKGLVDGVPTSIKDLAMMKGLPFRRGSRLTPEGEICKEDAPPVARLREHNAVFLGKTTTPEFGWKGVTDSALCGITRNPWDTTKTPGGSSGGASASVAVGMGALALGTDGGGSIRMPAGFTGIFGLYPTAGRIPYHPTSVMGTMSQMGPMTRTVTDGALMFSVMAAPDARDWIALEPTTTGYHEGLEDGVKGMRLAWSPTLGYAKNDPGIAEGVEKAVRALEAEGAIVEQVDHVFDDPREPYERLYNVGLARIYRTLTPEKQAMIDPGLAQMARNGLNVDVFSYADAHTARARYGEIVNALFQRYDLLLTPQLPLTAFEAGAEFPAGRGMRRWLDWNPFGYPFNFTNSPAATVPCGFVNGLPVALQIVGPRHREHRILKAARAYERRHPFVLPKPPAAKK